MKEKLVNKLQRLRRESPARQRHLAESHAQEYVLNAVKHCEEAATVAAAQGLSERCVWYDTVMTHGNIIPADSVYERVTRALEAEGVTASWNLEHESRTNLLKVVYRLNWD